MPKMLICTIGYQKYAVEDHRDAIALLDIAARMTRVEGGGWREPYHPEETTEPFVTSFEMADVEPPKAVEPEPEPKADEPLRVTEQRKLMHQKDEMPF